ncbi:unnamed protein product [Sphagnum balticum]
MMLQCARKDVATGFISGNLAQDTVHSQGFNTRGDGCKSQWPLLSVLVAAPHNSPQGADAVINCLMQMNSIIEQFFLVGDGKEGKFAFALQSQELFKCQGVNFTDRITMQLHPRLDGEEKSLSRQDGRMASVAKAQLRGLLATVGKWVIRNVDVSQSQEEDGSTDPVPGIGLRFCQMRSLV